MTVLLTSLSLKLLTEFAGKQIIISGVLQRDLSTFFSSRPAECVSLETTPFSSIPVNAGAAEMLMRETLEQSEWENRVSAVDKYLLEVSPDLVPAK